MWSNLQHTIRRSPPLMYKHTVIKSELSSLQSIINLLSNTNLQTGKLRHEPAVTPGHGSLTWLHLRGAIRENRKWPEYFVVLLKLMFPLKLASERDYKTNGCSVLPDRFPPSSFPHFPSSLRSFHFCIHLRLSLSLSPVCPRVHPRTAEVWPANLSI